MYILKENITYMNKITLAQREALDVRQLLHLYLVMSYTRLNTLSHRRFGISKNPNQYKLTNKKI